MIEEEISPKTIIKDVNERRPSKAFKDLQKLIYHYAIMDSKRDIARIRILLFEEKDFEKAAELIIACAARIDQELVLGREEQ